jgi:hypothetical protein
MDLSTIKANITRNLYSSLADLDKDVQLMFRNCLQFNGEDDPIAEVSFRFGSTQTTADSPLFVESSMETVST